MSLAKLAGIRHKQRCTLGLHAPVGYCLAPDARGGVRPLRAAKATPILLLQAVNHHVGVRPKVQVHLCRSRSSPCTPLTWWDTSSARCLSTAPLHSSRPAGADTAPSPAWLTSSCMHPSMCLECICSVDSVCPLCCTPRKQDQQTNEGTGCSNRWAVPAGHEGPAARPCLCTGWPAAALALHSSMCLFRCTMCGYISCSTGSQAVLHWGTRCREAVGAPEGSCSKVDTTPSPGLPCRVRLASFLCKHCQPSATSWRTRLSRILRKACTCCRAEQHAYSEQEPMHPFRC